MKKLLFFIFLLFSFNIYSQVCVDCNKISKLVFDKFNELRVEKNLTKFMWDDSLRNLAIKTNSILKKDDKIFHPKYDGDWDSNMKYWESVFVSTYERKLRKTEFSNFLQKKWRDKLNYSLFGEIVCAISPNENLGSISNKIVESFLKSPNHKWWIFLPNSLILNSEYSPFCSCETTMKEKENVLILTCNMYMIQLGSSFSPIEF